MANYNERLREKTGYGSITEIQAQIREHEHAIKVLTNAGTHDLAEINRKDRDYLKQVLTDFVNEPTTDENGHIILMPFVYDNRKKGDKGGKGR